MIAYQSKSTFFRNEIFSNVLSKFGLHGTLSTSTLD